MVESTIYNISFDIIRALVLGKNLGNVLVTVRDKKLVHTTNGEFDYFEADVTTATDFYLFGRSSICVDFPALRINLIAAIGNYQFKCNLYYMCINLSDGLPDAKAEK
jgi:hypothetical protein